MIGIDQEPKREALDSLDRLLGAGTYAISYAEESAGVRAIVRTHERPARQWSAHFPPNLTTDDVRDVWAALVLKIEAGTAQPPVDDAPPLDVPDDDAPPLDEVAAPAEPEAELESPPTEPAPPADDIGF